jgi:hypothetical protein
MSLHLTVVQTYSALTGTSQDGTDPAAGAATGSSANLSIRMSLDGQGSAADLASQLKGFSEVLYAAMRTLFGGTSSTSAGALGGSGSDVPVDPTAALADPSTAASQAVTPYPDAVVAATQDTTDTGATNSGTGQDGQAPGSDTSAGSNSSQSLTIKLRMTYQGFDSQMGSLSQQLAQTDANQAPHGLGSLLGDLSSRFDQMLFLTGHTAAQKPQLSEFLSALAKSLATPINVTPLPAPTDATSGTDATSSTDPAPAPDGTAATTDPAASPPPAQYTEMWAYASAGSNGFAFNAGMNTHLLQTA